MGAQYLTVQMHEFTRFWLLPGGTFDKGSIVAIGNKADILTVGLVGSYQAALFAHKADLGLGDVGQRQQNMCQLFLGKVKKHIALVFGVVVAAGQQPAVFRRVKNDTGIVACGQIIAVHQLGALK